MPYSSGTYSLPSGNPVVTGTTISSSTTNTTNSDIATALSTCVLKDGTQTITANLPMASHKLTGLSAGTTAGDSVEYGGSPSFTNLAYTGTLTGSTGILNIGSGQVYKDASGNVGIGTASPAQKLDVTGSINTSGSLNSINTFGFKNRIINGNMAIDQRNAGASTTPTTNGAYNLDRWRTSLSQASKFSIQQSSTAPAGFTKSIICTSLSAYTVGASENFNLQQCIEGFNIADLGWGTAGASTVTLSFWARSSLTGTFGGSLRNNDYNRSYPFNYTISSANTWEQKTVTIAGDTTGTWNIGSDGGLWATFSLGAGSSVSGTVSSWAAFNYASATGATSVVGTSGATFYITGVQLEKGSTATSFDYRPYGTELALCQRYYSFENGSLGGNSAFSGNVTNAGSYYANTTFKVTMRVAPVVTLTNSTNLSFSSTVGTAYPNTSGFVENRTANATGTGYFFSTWVATAEL